MWAQSQDPEILGTTLKDAGQVVYRVWLSSRTQMDAFVQAIWMSEREARALVELHSRRTTLRSELLIFSSPLYSMNPSFLNLFIKRFTRVRVVPTISANTV